MAITQAMCTSFKAELLLGVHDFRPSADTGADTFKLALYTSSASIDANTTAYTTSNEVTGTNYTAGGNALTNTGVTATNINANTGTGFCDFSDLVFANVTVTARGAMIYNTTPSANGTANTTLTRGLDISASVNGQPARHVPAEVSNRRDELDGVTHPVRW